MGRQVIDYDDCMKVRSPKERTFMEEVNVAIVGTTTTTTTTTTSTTTTTTTTTT